MPAAEYNFFIEQGSDHSMLFQYLDAENNLIPLSANNDCVIFKCQPLPTETVPSYGAIQIVSSSAAEDRSKFFINFNEAGEIVFFIPSSYTETYSWDSAIYDLFLIQNKSQPTTSKLRLATGTISLIKSNFPDLTCDLSSSSGSSTDGSDTTGDTTGDTTDTDTTPTTTTGDTTDGYDATSIDLCSTLCNSLDLYSELYQYKNQNETSNIVINDNSLSYGSIEISNSGIVENLEVVISGLVHSSPQDLSFVLTPPSGSGILLSHYEKIANYSTNNTASYVFSRKANPGIYLHNNVNNNLYINIYDKTHLHPSGSQFKTSFTHLYGLSASGTWTLNIYDDDPGSSGVLAGWGLIVHYDPDNIVDSSYLEDWDSYYITPTPSPTHTVTPTNTATATVTPTVTSTPTETPTNTPTMTVTRTPTVTPTNTMSQTVTMTQTATSTPSPTVTTTQTNTPTVTQTQTSTPTLTPTPSHTPTLPITTPSHTQTNTQSPTMTPTNTQTMTQTPTYTPTTTPTPTIPGLGVLFMSWDD